MRSAAVFRVAGERLSREGIESLRFDYHGTGDSLGDEADQSLDDWVHDTLIAHELVATDDVPVHWFGMGLGAVIALRAALLARRPPRHLVLWEPVLNGAQYLDALLEGHRTELAMMFAQPWDQLVRQAKVAEPTLPGDVLGFTFGARLVDELRALPDFNVLPALRRGLQVTCATRGDRPNPLAAHTGLAALRLHTVEHPTDWMSSQAMGTAIAPPDIPRVLLSSLN
ncbi:alpha/beta fold hydrolase [Hydrogenophaga sp.]|uniref:alpha/beta fold hydrolase n=1 Tax=Hydrogenophaga sp. TaxID=1904254 RepID=UPI0025C3ADAD|nr:alpha/beta fold hydrolase [Hydrogenophaga sp.]